MSALRGEITGEELRWGSRLEQSQFVVTRDWLEHPFAFVRPHEATVHVERTAMKAFSLEPGIQSATVPGFTTILWMPERRQESYDDLGLWDPVEDAIEVEEPAPSPSGFYIGHQLDPGVFPE
jgi:hypothetical protein